MSKIDGGLRGLFRKNITGGHWQAIETAATGLGVPDSNACIDRVEFWVEFKQTSAWAVGLEPEQVSWIDRRYRNGGRVWVAVRRCNDGGPRLGLPVDELWLFYGGVVKDLSTYGLKLDPGLVTGKWAGGAGRWDWTAVRRLLTGAQDAAAERQPGWIPPPGS